MLNQYNSYNQHKIVVQIIGEQHTECRSVRRNQSFIVAIQPAT